MQEPVFAGSPDVVLASCGHVFDLDVVVAGSGWVGVFHEEGKTSALAQSASRQQREFATHRQTHRDSFV